MVVPSFFLIMDDLQRVVSWIFGRFVGAARRGGGGARGRASSRPGIAARRAEIAALEARIMRVEAEGRGRGCTWRSSDGPARPRDRSEKRAARLTPAPPFAFC